MKVKAFVLAASLALMGCASAQKKQIKVYNEVQSVILQLKDVDCERYKKAISVVYPEAQMVDCNTLRIVLAGVDQLIEQKKAMLESQVSK